MPKYAILAAQIIVPTGPELWVPNVFYPGIERLCSPLPDLVKRLLRIGKHAKE